MRIELPINKPSCFGEIDEFDIENLSKCDACPFITSCWLKYCDKKY